MVRVCPLLLLLCLPLARGRGGNVQLTGLVEFGRLEKAYLLLDENRSVELAVGQTRGGYTLLRFDVRAGWCELQQGSNVVQLHFSSSLARPGVAGEPAAVAGQITTTPALTAVGGNGSARPAGIAEKEAQGVALTPPEENKTTTNALFAATAPGASDPSADKPLGPPQPPPLTEDQLLRIRLGGNGFNDLMRQRMWAASRGLPPP
ncbi:MAG: hypothetical protein ABSC03_07385 [Verrucomicrobiota bacterium]|jgi:hypothetical protein